MEIQGHYQCPFCGSTSFSKNTWSLDSGEVPALECNSCYAGAPLTAWKKLTPKPITPEEWNRRPGKSKKELEDAIVTLFLNTETIKCPEEVWESFVAVAETIRFRRGEL